MEQFGTIIENKGETSLVSLQRHLACEQCGRCGILAEGEKRNIIIEASNRIQADVGQLVILETDNRRVLFISFMLYLVPIGGLVGGIVLWLNLADHLGLTANQDLAAVGIGFGLMTIIFLFIRIWDNKARVNKYYQPVITGLVDKEEVAGEQ